jgi:voltage-gated potassium channel
VILLGATGLYTIERGRNESLTSFPDALWWAFSTTTTVGFGDIVPATGEGRLISILLMLTGITVVGVFTATLASLFMIEDEEDEFRGVHKRLDGIEAKLDRLVVDAARDTVSSAKSG